MYMQLARWCYAHRRPVVVVWIATVVLAGVAVALVGSDFTGNPEAPESESRDGFAVLEEHFDGLGAGPTGSIVFQADQGVTDPEVQAAMEELFAQTDEIPFVEVTSPYSPQAFGQIAEQGELAGQVAYARVEVGEEVGFSESGEIGVEILDRAEELEAEIDGLRIEVGGEVLAGFEPPESELIGLAFAVVVLIVSFGSVLAMGLPIAVAVAGVGLGIMLTNLASNVMGMPDFALQIGAMIGLGVGIDYALFIVTRFREYLHSGHDPEVATMAAIDTAGRAVVFAGITVVVSLLGLLLIGLEFVAGLGVAAAITVAVTMVASTTLLPALLGFARLKVEVTRWRGLVAAGCISVALLGAGLGIPALLLGVPAALAVLVVGSFIPVLKREVPRRAQKPVRESGWYRWSHLIQRRPWPFAIGGSLLLLVLALPLLGIRLGFSDEGNYPEESTTRQAYDLLSDGFGPGFNGPFVVVAEVEGPEGFAAFQQVIEAVSADPGVASATPAIPNDVDAPEAALARVVPTSAPQDEETEALINRLRGEVIPAAVGDGGPDVHVTGFVAVSVDFSDYLAGRSFVFFGVVLAMSFVLLMAVFRSLLVPLKAVVLNMLSIAGAYGIVVAVFQWGWLGDLTGIEPAPIEPFIPMMMFAIVFGLSMDYEVFLLSRIKEEYERTGDARNSVADGLAATARVISAAAAIMVVVFGSFLLEDGRIVKVFGAGLGMAVLLDATLVRMLLVPATMELLGERNWWIPGWIDRRLPALHVEGAPDHEAQLAAAEARVRADRGEEPDDVREPVGVS
ncbi:MAG TPA: MMPL family transporter [Acidimicrobiaceae bacterium]|nr:MMPL family transporter [Acidimicrobiaceae bacterium]